MKTRVEPQKTRVEPQKTRVRAPSITVRVSRPHKRLRILRVPAQYSSRMELYIYVNDDVLLW